MAGRAIVKRHRSTSATTFLTIIALVADASAQTATRDELRCALLGADHAAPCLRAVAERSSDLERAVELLVQTGDLSDAEALVERAFSQGERDHVWPAMLAVGRARLDRRQARAALDWYERWRDRAKRESTADVLAAVHTGVGNALLARDERVLAYEAFRLAVHVWRAEHAYRLEPNGSVLEEHEGEPGYVAPTLRSLPDLSVAARVLRPRVTPSAVDQCITQQWNYGDALRRCLRALYPPPPPPRNSRFEGLTEFGPSIYSPFAVLEQPDAERHRTREHRTRSNLSAAAFQRGNTASGEALFGMLRIQHDILVRASVPQYHGAPTRDAFMQWSEREITPFFSSARWVIEYAITPLAQQAMATGVREVELGAAQQLAHALHQFALWIREAPRPPDWYRPGEPYETMEAEW